MSPNRPETSLRHHAPLHRGLGRVAHGPAAGEEGEYDQRHHQQRPGRDGEADTRGYAVSFPGLVRSGLACWVLWFGFAFGMKGDCMGLNGVGCMDE